MGRITLVPGMGVVTPSGVNSAYRIAGTDANSRPKLRADVLLASTDDAGAALNTALAAADELVLSGSLYGSTVASFIAAFANQRKRIRVDGWAKLYTPDTGTPGLLMAGSRTAVTVAFSGASLSPGGYTYTHTTTGLASTLPGGSLVEIVSTQGGPTARGSDQDFLGEMNVVSAVTPPTDTTITFVEPLKDTYSLSGQTVTVYLVTPLCSSVDNGLEVIAPGGPGHPITTSSLRHVPVEFRWNHRLDIQGLIARGKYARHGIGIASCWRVRAFIEASDIRDLNATTFEGYGGRVMGGSHIELDVNGERNRHTFDAHNPAGTGLPSGEHRSIARDIDVKVSAYGDSSAASSTHGGVDGIRMEVTATGCSGGIVFRGRNLKFKLTMRGTHHLLGDYPSNQGYDHAIRIGEPNDSDSTQNGPCGTNIEGTLNFDFTNAPSVTAHGVYAEDPLIDAKIHFTKAIPTGVGLWARGDRNDNVELAGVIDASAQFSSTTTGAAVRFDAGHPASFTRNRRIHLDGLKTKGNLRNTAVYVQGGAGSGTPTDDVVISKLRVEQLGGSIDATYPMIELGAGYHGTVIVEDLDLPVSNRATAIKTSGATNLPTLIRNGERRYVDGWVRPGVDFLVSGEFRVEDNTGPSTYQVATGDSNLMRAVAVEGCGQTLDVGGFGVSTAAVLGAGTLGAYVLLFADDGNGSPALNMAPLAWTSAIDLTSTGYRSAAWAGGPNASAGIATEPVGTYHKVTLLQIGGTLTTLPLLETLTAKVRHVGAVMSGTSAVTTRNKTSQSGVSAAPSSSTQFTALTYDTTNRPAALIRKA